MSRIALAPIGTRGDVAPLVALGAALRTAGHDVHACVSRDFTFLFEQAGIPTTPIEADAAEFVQDLGGRLRDIIDLGRRLRPAAEAAQVALGAACEGADVVIGSGFQILAPALCEAGGIRYVYASTSPTLERSVTIPPHFAPYYGLGPALNWVLWRGQDIALAKLFTPILDDHRAALGLGRQKQRVWDAITAPASLLRLYDGVVVGESFGRDALGACFGGWSPTPLPDDVAEFLDAGAPPVMVTVGSVAGPDPHERVGAVVSAIRAGGRRVILDGAFDVDGRLSGADDVCSISGVDYRSLFNRLGAVVHHGGAGTIALAARAGVPQVVVPHVVDQFFWARRVATIGAGSKPVPTKRFTPSRIATAIAEATSPAVVAKAQALARELASLDGPTQAANVVLA